MIEGTDGAHVEAGDVINLLTRAKRNCMYKASINLIKPREELVSDDKVLVVFNHRLSEVFLACPNYVVILSTESFGQFLRGGWVAGNYVLAAGPPVQETARVRLVG